MTEHSGRERQLCLIGRVAQRLGCLPKRFASSPVHYPISKSSPYHFTIPFPQPLVAIRPLDNDSDHDYSDDIKYNPVPRHPPWYLDEPKPEMTPNVTPYRYKPLQPPKRSKKIPVAQTVPLTTLTLPGVHTVSAVCLTLNLLPQ